MKNYTFLQFCEDVLKEADIPLKSREIWDTGVELGLDQKLNSVGKTPADTVAARLYSDAKKPDSAFIEIGSSPKRFFLKSRESELTEELEREIEKREAEEEKRIVAQLTTYKERDLHPLLTYFAYSNPEFNKDRPIYTKTIYHEKTKQGRFNEWIHPDMVGCQMPIGIWDETVLEFNDKTESNSTQLLSFELKKGITKSNYRESFFQAISNSSWAHEGYLVAATIQDDEGLINELGRLNASFGIGLIKLNLENIDDSKIIFPARPRTNLDWEFMNKLCIANKNFKSFLDNINDNIARKKNFTGTFDKIIDDAEAYISTKMKISQK